MTNQTKFPEFINTYQRVLISDWPTIAILIFKHSCLLKEGGYNKQQFDASPTNVLSERQIQDALQGPYSAFFINKIKSFAILARLRMATHIDKEDSLKDNLSSLDKALELDPKKLESFPADEVSKLQEEFNGLTNDHCQQWEGQLFFWQMSLTSAMRDSGVSITEMESDEFSECEPVSELLDRYNDLNLTPPKVDYPLSFADYFRLKAFMTIQGALSRMHLPHDTKDIEKHMKALKSALNEIEKKEKELIKEQQIETDELLRPISFVKLHPKKK